MDKVSQALLPPNCFSANRIQWDPEVLHFCPTTPVILLGLKSDLRHKRNCIELLRTQGLTPVTVEQGQSVARRMGATYMECSSKEMTGVEDIFDRAITIAVGDAYKTSSSRGSKTGFGDVGGGGGAKRKKMRSCKLL